MDSEAISASRKRPGMIYVKLLRALSICDTDPAFLVMNSSYMDSHCGRSRLPRDGFGVLEEIEFGSGAIAEDIMA